MTSSASPALYGFRRADHRSERGCGAYQLADRRACVDEHRCAQGGQARGMHRADGAHDRGVPPGRRGAEAVGQEVLHDGDDRLHPRVPVRERTGGAGRARPHPVHPRGAPPGNGRGQLAGLLARHAADALRDALRRPGARPDRQVHRVGFLPRLRPGGRQVRGTTARRSRSRPRTSSSRIRPPRRDHTVPR